MTEISISCFYGRWVEERIGETIRKFAETSLPTSEPFSGADTPFQGTTLPKSRNDWGKLALFWLLLLQEWILTASIRSSASQAIQESNLSLLPWAGYHERWSKMGIWTTGHLKDVFPAGVYRGILDWSVCILTSKWENFVNTENINADLQHSSPAEEKKQVASGKQVAKRHCGTKQDLGLFLEAADKILVLRHFFFFFFLLACPRNLPCITKRRSWCSANCSILCVLVLYRQQPAKTVCGSNASMQEGIQYVAAKESTNKCSACERGKSWVLETYCHH